MYPRPMAHSQALTGVIGDSRPFTISLWSVLRANRGFERPQPAYGPRYFHHRIDGPRRSPRGGVPCLRLFNLGWRTLCSHRAGWRSNRCRGNEFTQSRRGSEEVGTDPNDGVPTNARVSGEYFERGWYSVERQVWGWCGFLCGGDDEQQPSASVVPANASSKSETAS